MNGFIYVFTMLVCVVMSKEYHLKNSIILEFKTEPGIDYDIKISPRPPILHVNEVGGGVVINYSIPQYVDIQRIEAIYNGEFLHLFLPKMIDNSIQWVEEGKMYKLKYKPVSVVDELEKLKHLVG